MKRKQKFSFLDSLGNNIRYYNCYRVVRVILFSIVVVFMMEKERYRIDRWNEGRDRYQTLYIISSIYLSIYLSFYLHASLVDLLLDGAEGLQHLLHLPAIHLYSSLTSRTTTTTTIINSIIIIIIFSTTTTIITIIPSSRCLIGPHRSNNIYIGDRLIDVISGLGGSN